MPARLLLAGAAAVALIAAVVVVVVVAASSDETAAPTDTLRRGPPPPPLELPAPSPVSRGDARTGADVFAAAGCGNCHTLLAADASGTIGPALDERTPNYERFLAQVTEGGLGMPAYRDRLTEAEIEDVVAFVLEAITP